MPAPNDVSHSTIRVTLLVWLLTLLAVVVLAVGLLLGALLPSSRWTWRLGVVLLAAALVVWPRIYTRVARGYLDLSWTAFWGAALATLALGAGLAAYAWRAARGSRVVSGPRTGTPSSYATVTPSGIDVAVQVSPPPDDAAAPGRSADAEPPTLEGTWRGEAEGVALRVSLARSGSSLSGTGELRDAEGGERRVDVSGTTDALPALELTLGPGLSFVGRLVEGPEGRALRGRLLGAGAPRATLRLEAEG